MTLDEIMRDIARECANPSMGANETPIKATARLFALAGDVLTEAVDFEETSSCDSYDRMWGLTVYIGGDIVRFLEGIGILQADSLDRILKERNRAVEIWPIWPGNVVNAAAILAEEIGELIRAANQHEYAWPDVVEARREEMVVEAIQSGAMAIRFLEGWDFYAAAGEEEPS